MAKPKETFKKRDKEMKRREKREMKNQRRLEKKALARKGEATQSSEGLPDDSLNESKAQT
ncbi:MAG: hypothetical protein WBG37_14570 [Desulfobacterales bacterium]